MKKLNPKLLRKRITVYIVLTMIILVTFSSVVTITFQKYNDTLEEKAYEQQLHKSIKHVIDRYIKNYNHLSERIVKTKGIIKLIENGDRQELYELLKPKWDLMRKYRHDLNLMHISLADGTSFLRMQHPDDYGDYVLDTRPILKKVTQTKKTMTAYESCKYDTAYRIVTPIFNKNHEYIATLEVGVNPNIILHTVNEINGCEGLIFVKEDELKLFGKQSELVIDGYSLQSKTTPARVEIIKTLKTLNTLNNEAELSSGEKKYVMYAFVLKDFKNENKVKLLFFQDVSNSSVLENFAFLFILTMAILLSYVAWLVYRRIGIYETNVVNLYNKQKELILSQSKHAAMGEMISMIAHQWRQPISVISMDANNIMVDLELKSMDIKRLKKDTRDIIDQTKHLSQTIDDFRDFFKPDKQKNKVLISDVFMDAYDITKKSFIPYDIEIENDFNTQTEVKVFSRELLQVFVNLLKNAQESLVDFRDKDRKITTIIYETKDNIVVKVCDNGIGVKDEMKNKIFEPYFSTKDEKNGTGLGLYMSQTIIEKHIEGSLYVEDYNEGACFIVEIPKNKHDN